MKLIQKIIDFLSRTNSATKSRNIDLNASNSNKSEAGRKKREDNRNNRKQELIDPTVLKVSRLIKQLNAGDANFEEQTKKRLTAALELSKMGNLARPAIPILIEKLFDITKEIRKASKYTLEKIDDEYFKDWRAVEKIPFLIRRLGDDKQANIATATRVLKVMGEKASDYLIDFLTKEVDQYDKVKVIQILSQIRPYHKDVFKLIIDEVQNAENRAVKEAAIIALGNLGLASEEILTLLVNELSLKNATYTKEAVLKALAKFEKESIIVIPRIIICFGDDNPKIRKEAINTVVRMGELAIPYLLEFHNRKSAYSEQDIRELQGKFEQLTIDTSRVQIHMSNFQKLNNLEWYIKEFFDVLNRPVHLNNGIVESLKRLGYFSDELK